MSHFVTVRFNLRSNFQAVRAALRGHLDAAFDDLQEQSVNWVRYQMLTGYNEPHGDDGHTEIYDTGRLYESIQANVETNLRLFHRVTVGSSVPYAIYVHNGTYRLHGRPFIRDAMDAHQNEIQDIIRAHVRRMNNE